MSTLLVAWACVILGSCGPGHYRHPPSADFHDTSGGGVALPSGASMYTTARGTEGVRGGAKANEAKAFLDEELAARGDIAEPDGRLASTAAWLLKVMVLRQPTDSGTVTQAAQRVGFAGLIHGSMVGSFAEDQTRAALRDVVAQVPKNRPITRYGIVAGDGPEVAIVLGMAEAALADFPRSVAPGGSLHLKGEVSERFQRASVFATNPDGKVAEVPLKDRAVDVTVPFPSAGVYALEVVGYGSTGPVVIVNVPIYVGVSEERVTASSSGEADGALTAEQSEAKLLELLNAERTKRGLGKLQADAELRAVALAHSTDMIENHFFGHVSPTTGTLDDRVRAAHLKVSRSGECVAFDFSPAGAHRSLMDSPAHRASMLDPLFTHVGIGVANGLANGQRRLSVTLLFGRRPPLADARMSTSEVLAAVQAFRKAQNLPELKVDPVLSAAAGAGGKALAEGSAKDAQQVLAAVGREMQRQVNRTRQSRAACQLYLDLLDRRQLADIPLLKRADIVTIGLGSAPLQDESGPKLGVVIMADGGPGKPVPCH